MKRKRLTEEQVNSILTKHKAGLLWQLTAGDR